MSHIKLDRYEEICQQSYRRPRAVMLVNDRKSQK